MGELEVNEITDTAKTEIKLHTYDEAVELTGHGCYNYLVLLACSVTSLAFGMDVFGFSIAMAGAKCDLQLDITTTGLLMSSPFAGVVFAFPWGYYADTRGRRRALLLSTSVGFIMAALTSLAPNWQTMLLCKVIGCSFSSAAFTLTMTYLGECTGSGRRSQFMLIMASCNQTADLLLYLSAYIVLPLSFNMPVSFLGIYFRPWRLYLIVIAIPLGIGAILMFFLHESPKFLANKGEVSAALEVLKKIYATNGGEDDSYPVKSFLLENKEDHSKRTFWESIVQQTMPLFRPPLLWRTLQLFFLMAVCFCPSNVFIMWYPVMVNMFFNSYSEGGDISFCNRVVTNISSTDESNYTCDDTMSVNTIYAGLILGIVYMIIGFLVSLVARWRRLVLISCYLVSAVCLVTVDHVSNPVGTLVLFTLTMFTSVGIGCVASYFVDFYPTSYRGMVASLGVMVARLLTLGAINVVGATIVDYCSLVFYLIAAYVLSGIITALFLPPDKKPQVKIVT